MKRIMMLLAGAMLLLFGTTAASAQADTPPDLTGVQQTNVDPLSIEGIQIMEPGRYHLETEPEFVGVGKPRKPVNLYLMPGVHELALAYGKYISTMHNTNVFFAPGAILYIPPGSGLSLGFGTQLIGPGPGNGTRTVFAGASFWATWDVTIAGHDVGLEIRNQTPYRTIEYPERNDGMQVSFGLPGYRYASSDDSTGYVVYGAQFVDNGVGIIMKEAALTDIPRGTLEIHWSVFGNNGQNTDIDLKAANVSFASTKTRFLAPGSEVPFSLQGASFLNPARFTDCVFSTNPWLVPSFANAHSDGDVVFSETRLSLTGPVERRVHPRKDQFSPADYDGSGAVDADDAVLLARAFGSTRESNQFVRFYEQTSRNGKDGIVGLDEIAGFFYVVANAAPSDPFTALAENQAVQEFVPVFMEHQPIMDAAKNDPEFAAFIRAYQNGLTPTAVLESRAEVPASFSLGQNYPNPFNSGTVIRFQLPEEADVALAVYNTAGQVVARLVDERLSAGAYIQPWDGLDVHGKPVSSGMYLYRIRAVELVPGSDRGYEQVNKMTLLR